MVNINKNHKIQKVTNSTTNPLSWSLYCTLWEAPIEIPGANALGSERYIILSKKLYINKIVGPQTMSVKAAKAITYRPTGSLTARSNLGAKIKGME